MREEGCYKYWPTFIKELGYHDMGVVAGMCNLLHTFPTFASRRNIMFTDKCVVYLSARFWDVHIWAKQNSHFFEEVHIIIIIIHLMLCCGLQSLVKWFFDHFFFDVSVTGESCLELLSHWLIPELDNVGLLDSVILEEVRAPAHYASDMRAFQNSQSPLWIGWHGRLIWPPRSPDLTMCNKWLSFVKEQLSIICMHSVVELKGEICHIFNTIMPVMLWQALRHSWHWMQLCVDMFIMTVTIAFGWTVEVLCGEWCYICWFCNMCIDISVIFLCN
jgi:hypothetical protein